MSKKSLLSGLLAVGGLLTTSSAFAVDAVSTEYVNMRSAPYAHAGKIEVIPSGASLDVKHCLAKRPWCQVAYRGNSGWASARFIDTKDPHSIPVAHETQRRAVKSVRYETVTKPVAETHTVAYIPGTRGSSNRSGSDESFASDVGKVVSAPFKMAANLVSAPFSALSRAGHSVTGTVGTQQVSYDGQVAGGNATQSINTNVQEVSYPTDRRTRKIIIEQQLPPVYVKEKDLANKSIKVISGQPTVTQTYATTQPQMERVSYVAHPTVQHVAAKEPQAKRVAYVEKRKVSEVAYRPEPKVGGYSTVSVKPLHKDLGSCHYRNVSLQRDTSSRSVRPVSVSYQQKAKPEISKVVYKKTTTTTTMRAPESKSFLGNVSDRMSGFGMDNNQITNVDYRSGRHVRDYNPKYPTDNIHNREFHRNETRYLVK